jgi:hypothetical protein
MKLGKPADDTWLLVSPEYTFAAPLEKSVGKPAMQTSTANEGKLLAEMKRLTNDYPHLLLAPGTIAVAEERPMPPHWARNTSHAYSAMDACNHVLHCRPSDAAPFAAAAPVEAKA